MDPNSAPPLFSESLPPSGNRISLPIVIMAIVLILVIASGSYYLGLQSHHSTSQPTAAVPTVAPTVTLETPPNSPTIQPLNIKKQTVVITTNPPTSVFPSSPDNEFKAYTNNGMKVTLQYPTHWKMVSNCKFGAICFSSTDFQEKLSGVGDGGGFYYAIKGNLFSLSSSPRMSEMKLDDFCHPGGPIKIHSCFDLTLDGYSAKKRIEVLDNNVEFATTIAVLTENQFLTIGLTYASKEDSVLLDKILSTFKFIK
ncbi:hypothetical protein HGA88_05345 [Candidatus Roizmanbacteria bacterium]|nr:hypothetical protein [Candidatus Roizmanbacteria bacterium]